MKKLIYAALVALTACSGAHNPENRTAPVPTLAPDYAGVTFPVNIAAPTFVADGKFSALQTQVGRCGKEPAITVQSGADGEVTIPLDKWHKLLDEAKGDSIYFRFAMRGADGKWNGAKADVVSYVSPDTIDSYLVYRLLYPGYELWSQIGIYERNLTNYDVRPVLENKDFDQQCINCHNFSANLPAQGTMIHVRGAQGGTLIQRNGTTEKINSKFTGANHGATYPGWSRDGRFIVFSANQVGQMFHTSGAKPIEVLDEASDLMVYDVEKHVAYSDSTISGSRWLETFPTWAPDSKTLYFCRASADSISRNRPAQNRYALCAVDFNPANGTFANLRTLYDAPADGHTVSFPRVSPDGRWLMFTRAAYGTFTIWHPEAQLCLMDLNTGQWHELGPDVNSESVESYHSWSSTGRWFVFSSKRLDGLWARPFVAHFDPATGRVTKALAVPQKSPRFYERFTRTFNIPELITAPVVDVDALLHGIIGQQPQEIKLENR